MEWQLVWGQREEGLLAVERQTGETPQALLSRPELLPWLTWYYDAFWVLDSGRQIYQGSVGRIPLSEMAAYMDVFDIFEIDAKQTFITTMRSLDSIYVKHVNAEIQRKMKVDRANAERERDRNGRR